MYNFNQDENPFLVERQQQEQQQQVNPMQAYNMYSQFAGGAGAGTTGGATGGSAAGGSAGSSAGGAGMGAAGIWGAVAALIAAKAYDTKKATGASYKDQLKDPSIAPQTDYDRLDENYNIDKFAPLEGGEVYKGTFDLAAGDFKGWGKSLSAPLRGLKDIF